MSNIDIAAKLYEKTFCTLISEAKQADEGMIWVKNKKSQEIYQVTKEYFNQHRNKYDVPEESEIKSFNDVGDSKTRDKFIQAAKDGEFHKYIKDMYDSKELDTLIPVFKELRTLKQDPKHHPEGAVGIHSVYVVKEAERLSDDVVFLMAALLHDVGKSTTTTEDEKGIHSYGHEEVSGKMAPSILRKLGFTDEKMISDVAFLCKYHMIPHIKDISEKKVHQRTREFGKDAMRMLVAIARADKRGRPPSVPDETAADRFLGFVESFKEE